MMRTFDELLDHLEFHVLRPNYGEVPRVKKALRAMYDDAAAEEHERCVQVLLKAARSAFTPFEEGMNADAWRALQKPTRALYDAADLLRDSGPQGTNETKEKT
jgi:hypothetical protein